MKSFVLLLAVTAAVCGSSAANIVMMPEADVRAQHKGGATDFNFIMNLMLMGMPDEIVAKARRDLQGRFGAGLQAPQVPAPGPGPEYSSDDPVQLKRKKRSFDDPFFSDFNNNFNNNFNHGPGGYDQTPTNNDVPANDGNYISYPADASSSSTSSSSSSFSSHRSYGWGRRLICPQQVDQGRVYAYGNNIESYPVTDIGQELFVRSLPGSDLLFQSLSRSVIFPTDPPPILQDEFLATSNATCRSAEDQVWSYESLVYTGRCYPLVNFQETPFFTTCLNRYCSNCQSSSYYHYYNRANVCITEYRQVSLWVYCESLLPNRRIVKDRILVPTCCTCTTVQCQDSWRRHRRSRGRSRW